ncbi:MAG: hypothetical protein IKK14_08145 [Oscillospiraceae bacterium]|nr:hypothetical protein [Oscillospiraceae bacterium]
MKKIVALILVFLLLCGCSVPEEPIIDEPQSEPEASSESSFESSSEETEEKEPPVLKVPESYYAYRKGVVNYSTIDPESDFAKSAVDFALAYLEKNFSENEEIESFEITAVEVDIANTNWIVNTWQYNDSITHDDLLNNFLVVRYRCNIKAKEGLDYLNSYPDHDWNEPLEGHLCMVFDPNNKYDYTSVNGHKWEFWNSNIWPWNDLSYSDEEIFEKLYARTEEELPLHTFIEPDDKIALLAAEQVREKFEETLKNDPNVISYEILDIVPNINETNWFINMPSVGEDNLTTGTLTSYVLCISKRWKMEVVDEPTPTYGKYHSSQFYNEARDGIIESSVYMVYDCGEWKPLGFTKNPVDRFADLTDEKLIELINEMAS